MRRVVLALLFCIPALASQAAPTVAGRWEGRVEIPGREMPIVVDLAPDASGAWSGSIVIPGLDVKGAPLGNIFVTGAAVRFDIGDALGAAPNRAAFEARLNGDGRMVGKMLQAGNVARFALQKTGPAQVEFPRRSTPVAPELEGQWSGDYELGGYARHVTLNLHNHAGAAASAEFVVVGKQTTNVPVDLITQEGDLLSIESHAYGIKFEGRAVKSGEIEGTFEQGAFDLPLVLRRSAGRNS
jgi:hypothetical protein